MKTVHKKPGYDSDGDWNRLHEWVTTIVTDESANIVIRLAYSAFEQPESYEMKHADVDRRIMRGGILLAHARPGKQEEWREFLTGRARFAAQPDVTPPEAFDGVDLPALMQQADGLAIEFRDAIIRRPEPSRPTTEYVRCACGHEVARSLVMAASLGTSCPDCYDRMSDGQA